MKRLVAASLAAVSVWFGLPDNRGKVEPPPDTADKLAVTDPTPTGGIKLLHLTDPPTSIHRGSPNLFRKIPQATPRKSSGRHAKPAPVSTTSARPRVRTSRHSAGVVTKTVQTPPRTPAEFQAIAYRLVLARGWTLTDFHALVLLWNRESGWNPYAENASSGAYGIPQALPAAKMATAGADWRTNGVTQIMWGLQYIHDVYGTPSAAWAHSQATGWY